LGDDGLLNPQTDRQQYLREHQHRFPPGAFALGTSEWWQLPHDHRCPHAQKHAGGVQVGNLQAAAFI
jgi:hypothetical protein